MHEQTFHLNEKAPEFKCIHCNEVFMSRSSLRDHQIRLHGREGTIMQCEHDGCNKTFTNPALLRNHSRTHTDDRPFQCPYCDSRFKAKYHMENHSKRHTKIEGIFQCLLCSQGFTDPDHLHQHTTIIHDMTLESLSYCCEMCSQVFVRADLLQEHKKNEHGFYLCLKCDSQFGSVEDFTAHEQENHYELQALDIGLVEDIHNVDDFIKIKPDEDGI